MIDASKPKKHTAKIRPDGHSRCVEPRELYTIDGDGVEFLNDTDGTVTIIVPDQRVFGTSMMVTLKPGEQSGSYQVTERTEPASFPYTAYCHDTKEFAHASVPIIIIYPRAN